MREPSETVLQTIEQAIPPESLKLLNGTLAMVEGLMRASGRDPVWLQEHNVPMGQEPSWLSNHETACAFFCAIQDYQSALVILERLCPQMGAFIDDTKELASEERHPILQRYLALCWRIGDFRVLWGVEETHTRREIIQIHRRCSKLLAAAAE